MCASERAAEECEQTAKLDGHAETSPAPHDSQRQQRNGKGGKGKGKHDEAVGERRAKDQGRRERRRVNRGRESRE